MTTSHANVPSMTQPAPVMDIDAVRERFPIFATRDGQQSIAYLDSAATTQKPRSVIEAVGDFYRTSNANVHRGVHQLSQRATALFEEGRHAARRFLNARESDEVIFTRGATESLNIVAQCFGRSCLKPGDEILLTELEHHSNIVPWQMVREATGAVIQVVPINDRGELELDALDELLTERTKIVGVVHVSNALGTINPVQEITRRAHEKGAVVVVDGAQATPHHQVDVQQLDCDFYAVSGHKMYGPTGIGLLYGRGEHLRKMPPWLGGGDMIKSVTFEKTLYADPPSRFEAGTPNVAGVVGLTKAIEFIDELGIEAIAAHEAILLTRATEALRAMPDLTLYGTAMSKAAVLSFTLGAIHPHDLGTILDHEGVAIRTGHHCTQPLMERLGVPATARASFGVYNTAEDVDRLVAALETARKVFS